MIEYLRRQPNVSFTWGNHDAAWIGACLGQEALIAHVLRISLRYRRLSQLEEGYGITLQPLEQLVRAVYADDPAERFTPKGNGLRETVTMARMQKAAAIMQFKLEGQTIARHPEWRTGPPAAAAPDRPRGGHRSRSTARPIRCATATSRPSTPRIPTSSPPRSGSAWTGCASRSWPARSCGSTCSFLVERGSMWLRRDDHLIFHGCVPVDDDGRVPAP